MKLLVCGGAGFIGSNFIRYMLSAYPEVSIVNYDALTYAANPDNLLDVVARFGSRYAFVHGDIIDNTKVVATIREYHIDSLISFAAETHVDRSIHLGAFPFVRTNVLGVCSLLDAVKQTGIERFVNVSTDEVFGKLELDEDRLFTEETAFAPNVPYAAAKAGGDLLCRAYAKTHGTPVVVTHCSNNYGPYQFPEKLIPFVIFRALAHEPVPIYGDGLHVRDWIFVEDHCTALDQALRHGRSGEVYNIGVDNELNNLEVVDAILDILGKPHTLKEHVADRPGHDRRYAIDATRIRGLNWAPVYSADRFAEGLERTVRWYLDNGPWIDRLRQRAAEINAHIQVADHQPQVNV
ncbi:MAG: dTDP-glucose 4,6-dehydratase [Candidatus Uhrbacteria bacterium]